MKWILLDLGWILYRAAHSLGSLSYGDDGTGIIYGFFQQLKNIMTDPLIQSNKVLVFADSRHSFRKVLYPLYKSKRHQNLSPEDVAMRKEMKRQRGILVKKVLPSVGIPVYRQWGLESDDLIARAATIIDRQFKEKAVIITADGDLFQCITDRVSWYDPQRNLHLTPETFLAKKGVEAKVWGRVKILSGCRSDNVPGIRGVGEKTAIKFLKGELGVKSKAFPAIMHAMDDQSRNEKLVVLPHEKTKKMCIKEPEWNVEGFFDVCESLGFDSFLEDGERWENQLRGRIGQGQRTRKRGQQYE